MKGIHQCDSVTHPQEMIRVHDPRFLVFLEPKVAHHEHLDLLSVLAFILGFMEERVICIYGFHGNMIYRWSAIYFSAINHDYCHSSA